MQDALAKAAIVAFLDRLGQAPASALLLDYDGTLAPFQIERQQAYPYPGVLQLLESIIRCGQARVVIISGRPIAELRALLLPLHNLEIWGSHGLEHQSADGACRQATVAPEIAVALQRAEAWLAETGLAHRTEVKPGGVAVHWRGMPEVRMQSVRTHAQKALGSFADQPGLKLLAFEGGLELRATQPNKGDAVAAILEESAPDTQIAFLGDDLTDEDAFRALAERGLSVLVRSEYRETNAKAWLRPPQELIGFLEQWLSGISR
jgi:trehalose 6-phosphate phosphatase